MEYEIKKATVDDLPVICQLFDEAILFQRSLNYTGWNSYDKGFITTEILNGLLYKLVSSDHVNCIFSICYSDPLIWREKEKGDALYLHRVIVARKLKGARIFQKVLNWAVNLATAKQLKFLRIDTWASNEKLIGYYKTYGFVFIENFTTSNSTHLPIQHRNLNVALLELDIRVSKTEKPAQNLEKINIMEQFAMINRYWDQRIIGEANGQLIKLAKGSGAINWHKHDDQDELFILYSGQLTIQLRDKNIEIFPNELFIVPKGVEHCPIAHGDSEFLIMGVNVTSNAAGGRPDKYDKK
ncbi:cupin domain-containing protein [Pedobacter sp. Du54]|uniref:cupin domain-containing protein n=1 Tax=Pedobacter anseongensis TaxID=3133439 RepID=UPI0030971794